ncbi:MAG TPA: DNA gyrase inhibitor YacG [Hyphomicrobiaceae bacterium]|nr:DNA gyrase inhibitor YacG [Hyphomicrobiaceae bacterium]
MTRSEPPPKPQAKCPICGRPSVEAYRPFCSRRCADVDLARWLSGAYAIPVADRDDDEDGTSLQDDGGTGEPGTRH